jgi:uncharacterized membrane protein YhhN
MLNTTIIILALPILAGLLFFVKKESTRGVIMTKPLLSALFIFVALSMPHVNQKYFGLVLAGLLFCLAGDVFLIFFSSRKLFTLGLISFLTGHIFYSIAFFTMATSGTLTMVTAVICITLSGLIFVWLKPYLGIMMAPVIAYIAVITTMVICAASFAGNEQAKYDGRVLAFCGASLFYISDIFVARHRFVNTAFINRLIGLPLYYTAQFMIAYSIGFF